MVSISDKWYFRYLRYHIAEVLIFAVFMDQLPQKLKPPNFNPCACAYTNTWPVYGCGFTYLRYHYPRKLNAKTLIVTNIDSW